MELYQMGHLQTANLLWIEFGINGTMNDVKNSFIHPLDDSRKVYMFSDAPHLIKNVRNRLVNKKSLRVYIFLRII